MMSNPLVGRVARHTVPASFVPELRTPISPNPMFRHAISALTGLSLLFAAGCSGSSSDSQVPVTPGPTDAPQFVQAPLLESNPNTNVPLVAMVKEPRGGELDGSRSFFAVEGDGVVLTAIKRAEDGQGLVLRLVESVGNDVEGSVRLPREIESAVEVDLLERRVGDAIFEGGRLRYAISGHEVKSFLVRLR